MGDRLYSKKCDPTRYWDLKAKECVLCGLKAGYGVPPNCGWDDDSGRHVPPFYECESSHFNDGSSVSCHPCTVCPPGQFQRSTCNRTTDTQCSPGLISDTQKTNTPAVAPNATPAPLVEHVLWAVPLALLCLLLIMLFFFWLKRKRGQKPALDFQRRLGFSPLSAPASGTVEETLNPAILSAPIQTVLNDLDVVEDLMILLDPETQGAKNTKHLASHCGFSSVWITYAYSMRDSKSPLKAVLEGVTSRQPDWTVRDMAKVLRQMERNDAIAVLARLRPGLVEV